MSISLEEVVVVSSKTKISGRNIKNADNKILINEIERVLESASLIGITEFKGKTIKINVEFELQATTDKQAIIFQKKDLTENLSTWMRLWLLV